MDFFSDDPQSVVNPRDMVMAFTRQKGESSERVISRKPGIDHLHLPGSHAIVQSSQQANPIGAWRNRNPRIYRGEGWIAVQSPYGCSRHDYALRRIGCLWSEANHPPWILWDNPERDLHRGYRPSTGGNSRRRNLLSLPSKGREKSAGPRDSKETLRLHGQDRAFLPSRERFGRPMLPIGKHRKR